MKVLFVTTNYYPYEGTCSNIINNLLHEGQLINKIDQISVLCSKKTIDDKDTEIINGIRIYRVFSWTLLNRKDFVYTIKYNKIKLISGIYNRAYNYLVKKFIPSLFIDYPTYKAFKSKLKKNVIDDYDLIISISGRYDCTKAVLDYVKYNNKKFILYQVDPCATNKIYSIKSKKRREKLELELYRRANYIITTPIIYDEHKNDFCAKYLSKTKSLEFPVVIPNSNKIEKKSSIYCMFLGSIYGGARDPKYTFELFNKIVNDNIQLHLVGIEYNDLPKEYRNKNFICYGKKDIKTCNKLIKKADFLINIGNIVNNQIPSKIFEYISTGKPIINICESEKCPTIKYMSKYPTAMNIIKNKEKYEEQVKNLETFILTKHKLLSNQEIKDLYYNSTPYYCGNEIIDIIKHI